MLSSVDDELPAIILLPWDSSIHKMKQCEMSIKLKLCFRFAVLFSSFIEIEVSVGRKLVRGQEISII